MITLKDGDGDGAGSGRRRASGAVFSVVKANSRLVALITNNNNLVTLYDKFLSLSNIGDTISSQLVIHDKWYTYAMNVKSLECLRLLHRRIVTIHTSWFFDEMLT